MGYLLPDHELLDGNAAPEDEAGAVCGKVPAGKVGDLELLDFLCELAREDLVLAGDVSREEARDILTQC